MSHSIWFQRPSFPSPVGRWSEKIWTPKIEYYISCFLFILLILHECLGPWTFWMIVFEQMQNTNLGHWYLWNQLLVFKKKIPSGNALQTGRKLCFFPRKKKSTLAFLLYKTFCSSVKKHQFRPLLPLKAMGLVLKKSTLGTKLFKQAPFFTKQAHFSRKCEFPCQAFSHDKVFSS